MAAIEHNEDTIAAIATPFGEGAVGIVRLSGPKAMDIVDEIFLSKNRRPLATLRTFSLRYGWIVTDKRSPERVIDEVVVSLMRGPKSYTREDVVEINSHGGARALSSILELVLEKGARPAQPGEFTKRAFLNGRLDLAQAEAVLDIIQAKSDLALKNSFAQLSGGLSKIITELRLALLEILARMEASIDFPEEAVGPADNADIRTAICGISGRLKSLVERSFRGRIIREGLKVVIYGKPNVGKSSLLNALLRQERAIVTPIAGTTRDTIEEFINVRGLAVKLIDTAGILEHRDEIEKEALKRTRRTLEDCDLVLFILDGSSPLTKEDRTLAQQIRLKKTLVVVNKCDRPLKIDPHGLEGLFSKPAINVSAQEGTHIEELEDGIYKSVFDGAPVLEEGVAVSNVRHIEILKRSLGFLENSLSSFDKRLSVEFVTLDVKKATQALGELTGEVSNEEVLDIIFSKFCIGK